MATVKIRATSLPRGDGDGITYYAQDFVDHPEQMRLVLAVVAPRQIVTDTVTGDHTAIVGIRRLEVITDPDDDRAFMRIMLRANQRRNGGTVLPMETEDEIELMFADFVDTPADPETPGDGTGE
jgi:hypothetical protein